MAIPQYSDEVLITLSSINPPSSFAFPDRRFFLTKDKPSMAIGRTSKRNNSYEAAMFNAWFDSPVMSRDHAHIKLDAEKQRVYIKDIGSLHGTFKNGQRLSRNIPSHFASGDTIRFGIPINRGSEVYSPCTMEASVKFGTVDPEDRPKVFRVPDDSDVEDFNSDDDNSIRNSSEILRNAEMRPANFSSPSPPVSLEEPWGTTEEDESEINLTDSTDMDTESIPEDGTSSAVSVSAESMPDYQVQGVLDDEEDEFEEHDEFDEEDYVSPLGADIPRQPLIIEDEPEPASEITDRGNNDSLEHTISQDVAPRVEGDMNPGLTTTHQDVEVNAEEGLMSMNERQDVPSLEPHAMHPSLSGADLPKIAVAPPWARPFVPPPPVRLPSFSETMFWSPPAPVQDAKTTAEIMGAKTGKYEFFAARAENKQKVVTPDLSSGGDVDTASASKAVVEEAIPVIIDLVDTPATSFKSTISAIPPPKESTKLATSEWTASGTQFLNSPDLGIEEPIQKDIPMLDETSAYQFELSKKASVDSKADKTPEPQAESRNATAMEINNILGSGGSPEVVEAHTPPSSKRKASQISELTPEEQSAGPSMLAGTRPQKITESEMTRRLRYLTAQRRARQAMLTKSVEERPNIPVPQAQDSDRPTKRLRQVAEMLGIAALGGVAVVSALIATAPPL